jgi:hypothetical protein
VTYGGAPGPGAFLGGTWSETYNNYSDDGATFVNGTVTTNGLTEGAYSAHLTMTGRHTGSQDADIAMQRLGLSGHATSTLDGHTIAGPTADMLNGGACPSILPKKPALKVAVRSLSAGTYRLTVTASIAGMGATESETDTRPVAGATIAGTKTNARGVATVHVKGKRRVTVTAGNTLAPATVTLGGR